MLRYRAPPYSAIYHALKDRDPARFLGTLEFSLHEGNYHYDRHRKCAVCCKSAQTLAAPGTCPVCGRPLTVGVLHRIELLADRAEGMLPDLVPSCEYLISLDELVSAALGFGHRSKKVQTVCDRLVAEVGSELAALCSAEIDEIASFAGSLVAEGVRRMRSGEVDIRPGYDGEYGAISVFSEEERQGVRGGDSLF